jgi:predicted ester cyclase
MVEREQGVARSVAVWPDRDLLASTEPGVHEFGHRAEELGGRLASIEQSELYLPFGDRLGVFGPRGENERAVRRLWEAREARDWQVLAEVCAPEVVKRRGSRVLASGRDQLIAHLQVVPAAFPDIRHRVELALVAGDRVLTSTAASGTHQGEFIGVAPTGRSVTWTGLDLFRLEDGLVVEWLDYQDIHGLLRQLGARISKP